MTNGAVLPVCREVEHWLLETFRHSILVEFFLPRIGAGTEDPERPHDLVGPANKFTWDVIKGMALQFREMPGLFEPYIRPAILTHQRGQYHHQQWNEPNKDATPDGLLVGAIDFITSYRGGRSYIRDGRRHAYDEIARVACAHTFQVPWRNFALERMRNSEQPNLDCVVSLTKHTNPGVPQEMFEQIVDRLWGTVETLRSKCGYHNLPMHRTKVMA